MIFEQITIYVLPENLRRLLCVVNIIIHIHGHVNKPLQRICGQSRGSAQPIKMRRTGHGNIIWNYRIRLFQ